MRATENNAACGLIFRKSHLIYKNGQFKPLYPDKIIKWFLTEEARDKFIKRRHDINIEGYINKNNII